MAHRWRASSGQVLSLKSRQFVAAAKVLGQSHAGILFRHLLPNLVGVILIYLTLTIPAVIIDESFSQLSGPRHPGPAGELGISTCRWCWRDQSFEKFLVAARLPGGLHVGVCSPLTFSGRCASRRL